MFDNLKKKHLLLVLPVAALLMAGCDEEEMAAAKAAAPAEVDLAQTEDLFSAPVKPNPLTTDPETVIVRVNGEDITLGEINKMMAVAMQRYGNQIPPEQMQMFQGQIFGQIKDELINQKLLAAAVAKANIVVDDAEVTKAIDDIRGNIPEDMTLEAILEKEGQTMESLTANIRDDLARRQLLESKVTDIQDATEEEAKEFYDSNPDQFKKPENVTASHILIKFGENETDETKAEKKAKLEAIRARIVAGDITFEDAAKENSEGPSAPQGGALGTFGKGQMVPEFEVAAYAQEVGEIGEVIETQFGYHIIKVTDHQEDGTITYDEIKDKILDYLTNQKKQQAVNDYRDSLRDGATIEEM